MSESAVVYEMTPAMQELEEKRRKAAEVPEVQDEDIPRPVGFQVLIAMPSVKDTFGDSAIMKTHQAKQHESIMSMVGLVIDMGSLAYKDKDRYPDGPWCKVGDYVLFRTNTGTRFRIYEQEYRFLNDDAIEGIVPNPNLVQRAW